MVIIYEIAHSKASRTMRYIHQQSGETAFRTSINLDEDRYLRAALIQRKPQLGPEEMILRGSQLEVKHEPVCKKLSKLTRKPFDSGKQRATGSDITYADVARAAKEREKLGGVYPRPLTNWKERHETFIDAVSSSKKVDYAIKTGAPLPPPPRTAVPSDYVQCNYCGRNFSEKAAERHIPFCKEQNARKVTSSSTRSLSGHRKTPVSNEVRNDTFEGTSQRRMRGTSRSPNKDDSQKRRKSLDTRNSSRSLQSSGRNSTQSAGTRQLQKSEVVTPIK
ncbi:hypothetical protein ANCCEY_05261 [Ancylostoma ceylanicum]|uniref:C2HC/C3H-type domain-containing protein n=1 Tax=Ancylostoma ceylanicum TaxID=53326 RepID=A0A0D6LUC2_9BILA|nr:hypothetical protein ANCCEY_05261 [Ancylostoma ceylanicum]